MKRNFNILTMVLVLLILPSVGFSWVQGIYINRSTVENTNRFHTIMNQAKKVGINTLIVDHKYPNKLFSRNVQLVRKKGFNHVARIVVFPDGGWPDQVRSPAYWQKIYQQVDQAINLGAQEIQLDYIRYSSKMRPSNQNAHDVHKVIKYFKNNVKRRGIPLQIAIFGEVSFGPSKRIGQDVKLFSNTVDVVSPMVYPSHYEPYRYHSENPYDIILKSLVSLNRQVGNRRPFRLYPYIEVYNYRYKMSWPHRINYIASEIQATRDGGADGFYAWSANNHYEALFQAIQRLN